MLISSSLPSWVLLLVLAPVLEEVVFRTGLQEGLMRRWPGPSGAWRAGCLTSVAFSVAHAVTRGPMLGLAVFVPASVIGWVYLRHQRVWPCIGLHILFNLVWILWAPPSIASIVKQS